MCTFSASAIILSHASRGPWYCCRPSSTKPLLHARVSPESPELYCCSSSFVHWEQYWAFRPKAKKKTTSCPVAQEKKVVKSVGGPGELGQRGKSFAPLLSLLDTPGLISKTDASSLPSTIQGRLTWQRSVAQQNCDKLEGCSNGMQTTSYGGKSHE